jgi:hypothetical protein
MTYVPEQQPEETRQAGHPEKSERVEQAGKDKRAEQATGAEQAKRTEQAKRSEQGDGAEYGDGVERGDHTERRDDAVHGSAAPGTIGGEAHKPLLGPDATAESATETPGAGSSKGRLTSGSGRGDDSDAGREGGSGLGGGARTSSSGTGTGTGTGKGTGTGTGTGTTAVTGGRATAAGTAPASGNGQAAGRTDGNEPLIPVGEREKLSHRLHEAVSGFVDGPRHAVEEADRVFEETVTRVTDTLTERRTALRTAWSGREDEDHASATEELRVALRTYREVTERLLEL